MKRRSSNLFLAGVLFCLAASGTVWAQEATPAGASAPVEHMVEMRDGVKLATSVFLPEGEGPWPAVLTRTPYGRTMFGKGSERYTKAGYAYVVQDCRGKFGSEGDYVPFERVKEDGYDTVEWVGAQAFCNGKVGMSGGSAMGITSNQAAATDPPHLVAAYVVVAPQSRFNEATFVGGVFKESQSVQWMKLQGVEHQVPALKARVVMDENWKKADLLFHLHKIDIPIYNVGGWYDIFQQGALKNFMYLQKEGREGARGNQKLLMGPFAHGALGGGLEYPGGTDLFSSMNEDLRWFNYWLKGEDNGIMDEPAVKYYLMASAKKGEASDKNGFVTAETWPPASMPVRYYLTDGPGLSLTPPTAVESSTPYSFDPANPVPTAGGANLMIDKGPMDQRAIGERPDYLRFQSPVLEEDLVVAGKIDFELFAATDGLDTDFMITLVDVYPDGYEALVVDCPIRTRYRFGRNAEDVKMMTPGKAEKIVVDLWSTAITFEKGHRIAVHVSSSNSPRFEVNANTGEAPGQSTMAPRVARNTIYHDAEHPTALVLPVVSSQDDAS